MSRTSRRFRRPGAKPIRRCATGPATARNGRKSSARGARSTRVIGGVVLARQRVLDIIEDHWDDGARCAGLVLDPALVRVQARAVKAFQGWRYLEPADAPADLTAANGTNGAEIPEEMRRALAALALI